MIISANVSDKFGAIHGVGRQETGREIANHLEVDTNTSERAAPRSNRTSDREVSKEKGLTCHTCMA